MKSVYIHIPFCNSICSYCDFCKSIYNEEVATNYLDALEREINTKYDGEVIKTLYIGGGTPSSLSIKNLEKLFSILKIFKLDTLNEFTFEVNVNDINLDLINLLLSNNVNRVSVGVESFDEARLKFLNRKHTKKQIKKNIGLLKQYFDNINIDIIYALPRQTVNEVKKDIKEFLKLDIPHISTYSLIIEKNTMIKIKNIKPISEELDREMYDTICKLLYRRGFHHYEVSNFSRYGFESNHNLCYWNNQEYYGFGLSSHGFINGVRYENTKSLTKYLKGEYRKEEFFLSKREDMENEVMLGLRKLDGINVEEFFNKFEVNIQDEFNIMPYLKNKSLVMNGKNLCIAKDKIYVMNDILVGVLGEKEYEEEKVNN